MEYKKKTDEELQEQLDPISYHVVREDGTEKPFSSPYNDLDQEGIYVDITTGEPLFLSTEKFDAGCGWPSFSKPVENALHNRKDHRFGMCRTEVRSKIGDSHLGHVFADGPKERGGLRYCINGAALDFIPKEEMEARGYGKYLKDLEK